MLPPQARWDALGLSRKQKAAVLSLLLVLLWANSAWSTRLVALLVGALAVRCHLKPAEVGRREGALRCAALLGALGRQGCHACAGLLGPLYAFVKEAVSARVPVQPSGLCGLRPTRWRHFQPPWVPLGNSSRLANASAAARCHGRVWSLLGWGIGRIVGGAARVAKLRLVPGLAGWLGMVAGVKRKAAHATSAVH